MNLAVDGMGTHAVWSTSGTGGTDISIRCEVQPANGPPSHEFSQRPINSITPRLVAASNGFLHLLWSELRIILPFSIPTEIPVVSGYPLARCLAGDHLRPTSLPILPVVSMLRG